MKMRIVGIVIAGLLLSGCTDADWNHTMNYVGLGQPEQSAPDTLAPQPTATADNAATPAPAVSKSEAWCREVAASAAQTAAGNGFDLATQKYRATTMYKQCMEFSDSNAP
ncbi:MAG: hypothetical protein KGI68_03975 [Alphaproteobacteria bacterium]|nr:hypothetical protein [Alphaproteobacteria bacterium]MDE1986062.1 hypothetical protein [Alphaproteobacteria bacterium]MDE2264392.1 hypothetical protein [Alphaproteobacteria bacterium]MDE2500438.1 hypothetical protein [Alphaproteobacteria bacterium]